MNINIKDLVCESKIENSNFSINKKIYLITPYIGIKRKEELAQTIIFDSKFRLNSSVDRYVNYVLTLLSCYLNININFKNKYEEYDLLNSSSLVDVLLNMIPQKERNEFSTIMNMVLDDLKNS